MSLLTGELYDTSSDDSDYVPGSDDESDDDIMTQESTETPLPQPSPKPSTSPSTYMQLLSHARKNNLPSFTYTPKSGSYKNTVQTYERQVGKTNLVYYKRRCV